MRKFKVGDLVQRRHFPGTMWVVAAVFSMIDGDIYKLKSGTDELYTMAIMLIPARYSALKELKPYV